MHRELKQNLNEARQCLSRRDAASDSGHGTAAAEASSAANKVLLKAGVLVSSLSEGLGKIQESNRLGEGELRRRRDMVSSARMERDGLEKLSRTIATPSSSSNTRNIYQPNSLSFAAEKSAEQAAAFRSGRPAGGRVLGAPLPETVKTRELDNEGVLVLQKQEMASQDEAIDQLTAVIRRQKAMGIQIKNEVDEQTEMLTALDQDVDRVNGKLSVARNRLKKL
jgi:regulator of vacuolar morphogenesis